MVTALPAEGFFLEVSGLPIHPLAVHAAVVLLPLSAIGLVAIVAVPRWRRPLGWVVLGGLLVGTGAAFLAKESGEALARVVGLPAEHARWGDILPLVAFLLLVLGAAWFWLWRRDDRAAAAAATGRRSSRTTAAPTGPDVWTTVTGIASIVVAVAVLGLTVVVGHSGAEAVWGGRLAASTTTTRPSPAPSAAPSGSGTVAAGSYTLAQVQQHASPSDCWAVVSGNVYDLTSWISQHPGGPGVIEGMCGADATAAFDGQHGGQPRPAEELARFLLGPLGQEVATGASATTGAPATSSAPSSAAAEDSTAAEGEDGSSAYTLTQVAEHASANDCWSAVGGSVYDLTAWIDQHPGGPQVIEAMCGKDGTASFNGQHEGQGDPAEALADFKIGTLA